MAEKNNKETEELIGCFEKPGTENLNQSEKYLNLREKYLALMDNYEKLTLENSDIRQENTSLTEKCGRFKNENKKLKDKIENLEYENKSLKNKYTNLIDNLTSIEEKYTEETEKYKSLKAENDKLQKKCSDLKESREILEAAYLSINETYLNLKAEYHKLNELNNMKKNNVYMALHQELKDLVETAHKIHNECYKVIEESYNENEETFTLPIDIQKVAEKLDIKIEFDNLNFEDQKRIDQNIAQLYYEESKGGIKKKIIVDNSISHKKSGPLSNLEKYAVAYELGKVIVGNDQNIDSKTARKLNLKSRPYSLPRLSAHLENFEYEMCAIFLLLPRELFFKEFQNFLDEIQDHPVMMEKWIEHLSEKADIPSYQLINGYQYIKFSAYCYYEKHLSNKTEDEQDYRDLYNI